MEAQRCVWIWCIFSNCLPVIIKKIVSLQTRSYSDFHFTEVKCHRALKCHANFNIFETCFSSTEVPGELPQCRMGNRRVDSMCFMISCTNWYWTGPRVLGSRWNRRTLEDLSAYVLLQQQKHRTSRSFNSKTRLMIRGRDGKGFQTMGHKSRGLCGRCLDFWWCQ